MPLQLRQPETQSRISNVLPMWDIQRQPIVRDRSMPTMPANVRRAVAIAGAITLWKFHELTRFDYDMLRQLIRSGRLPAVDLKPPTSRKSLIRLFLEHIEIFYDLRPAGDGTPFRVSNIFREAEIVPLKRLSEACCIKSNMLPF